MDKYENHIDKRIRELHERMREAWWKKEICIIFLN